MVHRSVNVETQCSRGGGRRREESNVDNSGGVAVVVQSSRVREVDMVEFACSDDLGDVQYSISSG